MLHETGFDRYFTNGHISDSPKKQLLVKQQLIDKSSFINEKKNRRELETTFPKGRRDNEAAIYNYYSYCLASRTICFVAIKFELLGSSPANYNAE